MSSTPPMTVQDANALLKKIINAKDVEEVKKIIQDNIMWCDGVFFAQLDDMVEEFKRRGDETSSIKLKHLGDYMARLRFMI